MQIAILGAGHVGQALGEAWRRGGHDVVYGVRKPDPADPTHRSVAAGVAGAEVVVNALPWPATRQVLEGLDLKGKILFDCTNPLRPDLSGLEFGGDTSGAEQVALWAPGARVVKIFNSTGFNNMADTHYEQGKPAMFYCGDDAEAKAAAKTLSGALGFEPVDAGPLQNARLLEPLAMLWIWLAYHGGMGREFAFQLMRR